MEEADIRCAAFIDDIIAVCKKHRVLLRADDRDEDPIEFAEYPAPGGDGFGFILGARDLEDAVRNAVWGIIHPSKNDQSVKDSDYEARN